MVTVNVDVNELVESLGDTRTDLLQVLSSFNDAAFNRAPSATSWTPGQVAEHLVLSNSGFLELLTGPTKYTERAPDELVSMLKETFLNFNTKMTSPEFVRPTGSVHVKADLIASLQDILTSIQATVQTADLTATCTAFNFPTIGFITGLEAATFIVCHTTRHIHQLKNLHKAL